MSAALIAKLLRSRESSVVAAGRTFTVRRPTDADALGLSGSTAITLAQRFVVGWDLQELDIIPGGGPDKVPFDAELWAAWMVDRPELWQPLSDAIVAAYSQHADARKDAEKN